MTASSAKRAKKPRAASRKTTLPFAALPLAMVYGLIEPGPVVLLTTSQKGRANVMTMSWHMMVEFEPPIIACVVSNGDFSFSALNATGECVIAIPDAKLARTVVDIGNCSGRDIDKFAAFGLEALAAKTVAAPLIAECFANLECKVRDRRLVKDYCLFLLEVTRAWLKPQDIAPKTLHHRGYGAFVVDGRLLKLKSKMR